MKFMLPVSENMQSRIQEATSAKLESTKGHLLFSAVSQKKMTEILLFTNLGKEMYTVSINKQDHYVFQGTQTHGKRVVSVSPDYHDHRALNRESCHV